VKPRSADGKLSSRFSPRVANDFRPSLQHEGVSSIPAAEPAASIQDARLAGALASDLSERRFPNRLRISGDWVNQVGETGIRVAQEAREAAE